MPGIVGLIGLNRSVSKLKSNFQDMVKALLYNEDDLTKVIEHERHLLGAVNIDDGRNVPKYFVNQDKSIECLIDGDIFVNHDIKKKIADMYHLSTSDSWPTFIPYLYKAFGEKLIKYVKGWFNLLIVDKKEQTYHLLNSRFGMRPLYYAVVNGYFVFSSELKSILKCSLIKNEINEKAIIEYALFHYPLGEDTYMRNVFLLNPAMHITIKDSKIMQHKYWEQESLFANELFSLRDSLEGAEAILKKVVNELHQDSEKIGISVTGGVDGRTILSLINKEKHDLLLYSFGIPESGDVEVPRKISEQLSYNYFPIYLDNNYVHKSFNEYARKAILFSDGRSSLARAHYPYVFELLSKRIKVVLTGICGSELLRPFCDTGVVIADNVKLLHTINHSCIDTIFDHCTSLKYYNKTMIDKVKPSILESIKTMTSHNNPELTLNQKLYVFIIREVFRKYFGVEMTMESPFLYNRSPYLDYEFVDFIFKTPLCGANYDFFTKNPFVRIHGQQLYSYIMSRNHKTLAKINTNKMYAPYDLLTTEGKMKAGLAYYYRKFFVKVRDEYNLTSGLKYFMLHNRNILNENEFLDIKNIIGDYDNGDWEKNKINFFKVISWAFWYNFIALKK